MSDNQDEQKPTSQEPDKKSASEKLLGFLLLLLVFMMASQWGMPFPPGKKPLLFVAYVDIVLGIAFLVWLVAFISKNGVKALIPRCGKEGCSWQVQSPPLAFYGFITITLISCAFAGSKKLALKEALQVIEFFAVAGLVFSNGFRTEESWRRAMVAFAAGTSAVLLLAFIQYFTEGNGFKISGTFGSKNILAVFIALVIPFFLGLAITEKDMPRKAWWLLLVAPGLLVCLSFGAIVAVIVGTLVVLAGTRCRGLLLGGCLAWTVLIAAGPHLYRHPNQMEMLHSSIALYIKSNYYFTPAGASEQMKEIVWLDKEGEAEGDFNTARDFLAAYENLHPNHPGLKPARDHMQKILDYFNKDVEDESEKISLDLSTPPDLVANSRYIRWHAAWKLIGSSRWLGLQGVGPGGFREGTNKHYPPGGPLRKPTAVGRGGAPDTFAITSNEPDSFNQYLVYAAELGLLGLLAFLWILFEGLGNTLAAIKSKNPQVRGIGLGVLGAVSSALIVAIFHPLVVRGLGLVLVFLLCAAQYAASSAAKEDSQAEAA